MFLKYFNDSLVRGFALTAILLLGVGLEQGLLLGAPNPEFALCFLFGNLMGLPVGLFLWTRYSQRWKIPLYLWPLAGVLVSICAWKQFLFLFVFLGLVFGVLILHLTILGLKRPIEKLIPSIGIGIALGNIILFILEQLPFPLGLALLGIALAGWRIKRPEPETVKNLVYDSINPVNPGLYWFWLFFLCFYIIGGFYYNKLGKSLSNITNQELPIVLDSLSLIFYVLGILSVVFFGKRHLRLNPYMAIMAMGLCVTMQITPESNSPYLLSFIDYGFGIMDCFVMAVLFAFSKDLLRAVIGLSIFPIAIICGMFLSDQLAETPLIDCQWMLAFLFFTIIPLHFSMRTPIKTGQKQQSNPVLALPRNIPPHKETESTLQREKSTQESYVTGGQTINFINNKLSKNDVQEFAQRLGLSHREYEVFERLIVDKKLKEIAKDLGLALGTIKALCNRIYEKAGMKGKKS